MEVKNSEKTGIVLYGNLLSDIKTRIRQAQDKVALCANAAIVKQPVSQSGCELTRALPDIVEKRLIRYHGEKICLA